MDYATPVKPSLFTSPSLTTRPSNIHIGGQHKSEGDKSLAAATFVRHEMTLYNKEIDQIGRNMKHVNFVIGDEKSRQIATETTYKKDHSDSPPKAYKTAPIIQR